MDPLSWLADRLFSTRQIPDHIRFTDGLYRAHRLGFRRGYVTAVVAAGALYAIGQGIRALLGGA